MKNHVDVSVIITAWKEPKTVGPLISEIERQIEEKKGKSFEILLVCPDEETRRAGLGSDRLGIVQWIQDDGVGKPSALNKVFQIAQGDWWIMTDGDVSWDRGVVTAMFVGPFGSLAGALTGHPIPKNPRNDIFGYWSHLLTEMAHRQRLERNQTNRFMVASGYLMAIKKDLVKKLPENVLSDDALISYIVANKGYQIKYVPDAKVIVKFPTNFKDWIKQKSRSGGGYAQLSEFIELPRDQMRSFSNEIKGIWDVLSYAENPREFFWTLLLLFARLYLWIKIFWERKVTRKSFKKTWTRIESTK